MIFLAQALQVGHDILFNYRAWRYALIPFFLMPVNDSE